MPHLRDRSTKIDRRTHPILHNFVINMTSIIFQCIIVKNGHCHNCFLKTGPLPKYSKRGIILFFKNGLFISYLLKVEVSQKYFSKVDCLKYYSLKSGYVLETMLCKVAVLQNHYLKNILPIQF